MNHDKESLTVINKLREPTDKTFLGALVRLVWFLYPDQQVNRVVLLLSAPLLLFPVAFEAKAELRAHQTIAHCGSCQVDQQNKTSKDTEQTEDSGHNHNHESSH